MFISKKHLDRRTFLRGMGATVALPLLDAMIPARTLLAATAARPVPRLAFVYFPHGAVMDEWTPADAGRDIQLGRDPRAAGAVQEPADDRQRPREPPCLRPGARDHAGHVAVRSCRRATARDSGRSGHTADQIGGGSHRPGHAAAVDRGRRGRAAEDRRRHLGRRVRRELRHDDLVPAGIGAPCRWNSVRARCSTSCSIAARPAGAAQHCARESRRAFSISSPPMPPTCGSASGLRTAPCSATTWTRSATSSVAWRRPKRGCCARRVAADVRAAFAERLTLMFDLIALAFRADITRVASVMMAAEASSMTYDHLGVPDSFHLLSHHQNDPAKIEQLVRIQAYHTRMFAAFVRTLAELPDGDGSMLDRSLILYGSNMSNSHAHDHFPLPLAVVGGGCGALRGGQHLRCPDRTPISNLLLTMLRRAGVPVESIGDSTGECADL